MPIVEWNDSYSVGVPALDNDHKRLIEIINRVDEAERAGNSVQWVLQELEDYAKRHFQREEERLEAIGFAGLAEHARQHHAFTEWVETVKQTYDLSPEAHFHLAATVRDYLRNWLVDQMQS